MWKEIEKTSVKYRVDDGETVILRVDGKNFSKLTKLYFKQPLDEKFSELMMKTAEELINWLQCSTLIYSQSDELNILLHPPRKQSQIAFGGKLQKIISLTAAKTSVTFTTLLGKEALFDARIILPRLHAEKTGKTLEESIKDYFRWRFLDGVRNSRNTFARYHLSPENMHGKTSKELIEEVEKKHGTSWHSLPDTLKYGFTVYRDDGVHTGTPKSATELEKIIEKLLTPGG